MFRISEFWQIELLVIIAVISRYVTLSIAKVRLIAPFLLFYVLGWEYIVQIVLYWDILIFE